MFLHEQRGANMMLEVEVLDGVKQVRVANGIVVGHKYHGGEATVTGGTLPVVDIKLADVATPKMTTLLNELRRMTRGKVTLLNF